VEQQAFKTNERSYEAAMAAIARMKKEMEERSTAYRRSLAEAEEAVIDLTQEETEVGAPASHVPHTYLAPASQMPHHPCLVTYIVPLPQDSCPTPASQLLPSHLPHACLITLLRLTPASHLPIVGGAGPVGLLASLQ
jgi:hypothetical protein